MSALALAVGFLAAIPLAIAATARCPWTWGRDGATTSWLPLLAGVLLAASGLLDVLDGRVARATGTASPEGALLDSTLDRLADLAVHLAIVVHAASRGDALLAALAMLAFSHGVLIAYLRARAEAFVPQAAAGFWQRPERCGLLVAGCVLGRVPQAVALLAILPAFTAWTRWRLARRLLRGEAAAPGAWPRGRAKWRLACAAVVAVLAVVPDVSPSAARRAGARAAP